ncbi:MAG TPA: AlpA family phage regulatory protein [Xanthobacteraceae bacterium]|jgi:predicted DNA-binding transcriptional regulator AlpA|nr:AlpA family phage regulatory protein [Xanthobacteraceae bacterium]
MRIISYDGLRSEKGITFSKVWLWKLERDGKFPLRVRLGEKRYGWPVEEIDAWLESRAAAREQPQAA